MCSHTAPSIERLRRLLFVAVVALAMLSLAQNSVQAQTPPAPIALSGRVDLLRLVDLASARLGLDVEYDANALKALTVELRIDESITDQELWTLTNQLLASRGFTSIQAAIRTTGEPRRRQLVSIVKLTDAAGLAQVEHDPNGPSMAGYASVLIDVKNRPLKDVLDAVKTLVSKPGGSVQEVAGLNAVLVSDLRQRVAQIVEIVHAMDAASGPSAVESIEATNLQATVLATLVTSAVISRNAMGAQALQGKLTATPDDTALVLIAPQSEIPKWHEIIAQFDRPSRSDTRTYSATAFPLAQTAQLLEQTARDSGPRGSGERWRIVQDDLGGLLIVTATPSEHLQIAAILQRLNTLPAEIRRPVRVFPIRNRSVADVVQVLTRMLEAGVLEGAEFTSVIGGTATAGPSTVAQSQLQRSPPTSSPPTLGPPALGPPTSAPPSAASSSLSSSDSDPIPALTDGSAPPRSANGIPTNGTSAPPSLTLTADEGTNTLIAVGEPRKLAQLEELLRTLDVRQPQVMIEVLVVSLSDGDTLDLGVELEKIEVSGDTVITLASLFGLAGAGGAVTGKGFSGLILNPGDFRVLIRALQTLNNGRSLNMPKVLVSNNQQANLDAVVQQPFVSTNASDTVATTSFGGFENAGTTISIKPQIAKGDHLLLEYSVSLSAFVGESSDPGVPPPRQQNNLQSVVTVPDGFTIVVGGIEVQTKADAVTQIPLVGDIPFIGEAFKSRSRSSSRSRFYVFIRPSILRQEGFEDLKYVSDVAARDSDVDDGFPEVTPRIIK